MLPEEPPDGCFSQVMGRPVDPRLVEKIRADGPEHLLALLKEPQLNEQSRYKLLRCFFPMTFKEFKALERRLACP
jgi:hypothetical protein